MAGARFNQSTCLSGCHPPIDAGTLNRNVSTRPGIISDTLSAAISTAGDGVATAMDAASLYATLYMEGLGFLVDVYGGKQGGGAKPIADAWDQRVKNMATAHATFSSAHRIEAMPQFNQLARWFAGDDAMKRRLLEWYIQGQGKDFALTLDMMKLMPTYIDLFETDAYSPSLLNAIAQAKTGQSVPIKTQVQGQNNALGNFTISLLGTLKPAVGTPSGPIVNPFANGLTAKNPGVPLMFEGTMTWSDYWDFDPKVAARLQGNTGRPATAEAAVNAVAALVDGMPFQVTSSSVAMTQYSGRFPKY